MVRKHVWVKTLVKIVPSNEEFLGSKRCELCQLIQLFFINCFDGVITFEGVIIFD